MLVKDVAKTVLPFGVRRWLRSQQKSWTRANPFGKTRSEMMEETAPISRANTRKPSDWAPSSCAMGQQAAERARRLLDQCRQAQTYLDY
jgi:hypothetical protein